jgi:microcystin-dependent protein
MEFQQEQTVLAAEMANFAGGDYCILRGCVLSGSTVSPGTVIVKGEILPFTGGNLNAKVCLKETKTSITAGSDTYEDAYIRRWIEFGINVDPATTFLWADFERTATLKSLSDELATKEELEELKDLVMPKGGIIMWSGSVENLPNGFALCNGATVDGVVTPDLRSRFIVGYDERKVNTPANATDLTENYGRISNTGGRTSVTLSGTQMPAHRHFANSIRGNDSGHSGYYYPFEDGTTSSDGITGTGGSTGVSGGSQAHENRPTYYVLAFIIKTV